MKGIKLKMQKTLKTPSKIKTKKTKYTGTCKNMQIETTLEVQWLRLAI